MLQRFSGGSPSVRSKLNAVVDELNPLTVIRGDETFIAVKRGPGGSVVSLNIAAVLARVPRQPLELFPCLVEKTGGSDGSKTTKASYTYTVGTLDGRTIDTAVGLTRPRPNGKMNFQSGTIAGGNAGYGLAFYDVDDDGDVTLILWDAGEVPNTGGCP